VSIRLPNVYITSDPLNISKVEFFTQNDSFVQSVNMKPNIELENETMNFLRNNSKSEIFLKISSNSTVYMATCNVIDHSYFYVHTAALICGLVFCLICLIAL
jgi:hypothetical protein